MTEKTEATSTGAGLSPDVSPRVFLTEDLDSPLDTVELFALQAPRPGIAPPPLELEIGCGNGRYIRRAAAERPEHLFLGIERSLGYARRARDRMVKYGVGNARILRADATRFLATHMPPASVHTLHVYFTDPWPKRRHAKRRLFQTPFLETVHRTLRPGGRIFVKVDLFWYFEEILCRFDASPHFRILSNGSDHDRNRDHYDITGFEQKALAKKGAIYYMVAENR